jgi:hypothetical protein
MLERPQPLEERRHRVPVGAIEPFGAGEPSLEADQLGRIAAGHRDVQRVAGEQP